MTQRNGSLLCLLGCLLFAGPACVPTAGFFTLLSGGDVIEPEYTLTKGPLLVMVDDTLNVVSDPKAIREVHQTISDKFLEMNVNRRVLPFSELEYLRQHERKFDRMKTREIGEKLGAEQVLYIWVERFTLQAEPGAPLYQGEFVTRVKVLTTERLRDVRLWPRGGTGRRCTASTEPVSVDSDTTSSEVAKELGQQLGETIAKLFYEHRELDE